jgi:hypothetical protein
MPHLAADAITISPGTDAARVIPPRAIQHTAPSSTAQSGSVPTPDGTLFTETQHEQLLANCQAQIIGMDNAQPDIDFKPVVKLFTPDAQCTWLLTELSLDDIAFGLCDLGLGLPGTRLRKHGRTARHSRSSRAPNRMRPALRSRQTSFSLRR